MSALNNIFASAIFLLKQRAGFTGSRHKVVNPLPYALESKLVSILIPVYNPEFSDLVAAVESAAHQSHKLCEIILVNDGSTDAGVRPLLDELSRKYSDVHVLNLEQNLGISGASQKALESASGDWVGLLDQDDLLELNAVESMLKFISKVPNAGLAYSDSDKVDSDGKFRDTYLKGDWSPERLRGNMYLAHFTFFRRSLALDVGGFRSEFDGAQDHDLALRISETDCDVVHVPEVLYHWRLSATSTAQNPDSKPFARDAGKRALEDHLKRINLDGEVNGISNYPGFYEIKRNPARETRVSVVIPTRGSSGSVFGQESELIIRCLQSMADRPQETLDEVVLVADQVDDLSYLVEAKKILGEKLKVVMYDKPFNFSEKVNTGISASKNDFILVLNDDVEMISDNWLDPLAAILEQEDVGGVGPLLRFEDGTIQHGGHFYAHGGATHRYLKEHWSPGYFGDLLLERESSGLTAAYLLIKKRDWESVGGFSLDFPNNFNDVDFCLKIRDIGKRLIFSPRVEAFHFESKTRESAVGWNEVAKITELWGHVLGASREPFGPGGKPRDFAQPETGALEYLKKFLGNVYYGRRPLLSSSATRNPELTSRPACKYSYKFNLRFHPDLPLQITSMIKQNFDELADLFYSEQSVDTSKLLQEITLWVNASIVLGQNSLSELAFAFENEDIDLAYSDYIYSLDSYQSSRYLPAWSRERFLGINYLGRLIATRFEKLEIGNSSLDCFDVKVRNEHLMNADPRTIARIPETLYRVIGDPIEDLLDETHLEWSLRWVSENRPKIKSSIYKSMISYEYRELGTDSVSIIIPTRFGSESNAEGPILETCLQTLTNQDMSNLKVEVILVVDTTSLTPRNSEIVEKFYDCLDIRIVHFDEPFNFSRKCNLGVKNSSGDTLLFLNDDTEWTNPNSLKELVGTLSLEFVGAVGALLRYPNGLIQHGGMIMATPAPGHAYVRQGQANGSLGDLRVTHEVSGVTGACFGIRRDLLSHVGGWNESFPNSYNDVDLSLRVKEHGKSIILNPRVELIHHESLTRDPQMKTSEVNRLLSKWSDELSWESYFRNSDAKGWSEAGVRLTLDLEKDYSGQYFRYAVFLLKKNGFTSLLAAFVRFISGTSRRWRFIAQKPSNY